LIQVLGSFSCPENQKLEFKVESIKLGPLGFGSRGEGFFTFFYVDEAVAVARGQGGGLALWYREKEVEG
jgi:hydrogenase maturation factor HypE